jgi:hypothetical protein
MLPKGWRNPTEIERQRLLDQFQAEYERAAELWPRMRKRFNDSLPAGKSPMATILAGA